MASDESAARPRRVPLIETLGTPETSHRYTHGHTEPVLRSHRWRTAANSAPHLLPHLRNGMRLLDVGSGPGTITADLAERVGATSMTAL